MGNELVTKASVSVKEQLPDWMKEYDGEETGTENIDTSGFRPPFLKLAQALSPECNPGIDNIEGLRPGMYFNSATQKIYGNVLRVILVKTFRRIVEWKSVNKDAKFIKAWLVEDFKKDIVYRVDEKYNWVDENGHCYKDTNYNFVVLPEYPDDGILCYSMSKTAMTPSNDWLRRIVSMKTPIWVRGWILKPEFIKGEKGDYFQIHKVIDDGFILESAREWAHEAFLSIKDIDKIDVAIKE